MTAATKGPATGDANSLIDFVLSESGQKAVKACGYVQVK